MSKVLIDSRRGCRRLATGAPTVILTRKPESIRLEKLWISDGPLATQIRYGVLKMSTSIVTAPAGETWFSIVREFDAPRRLIYRCYTTPEHMAHFWGPHGTTLTVCDIDLRVGGVWRVRWAYPDGRSWGYSSVYTAIVPDEAVHYRDAPYDWPGGFDGLPPVELDSTIALAGDDRRTTVTVTVRWTSVAARDAAVQQGFTGMVDIGHERLTAYLATLPE